jgi:outer membrane protein assembly factor BamE (lipoprotein component of BamABCDE complex)
MKAIKAGVLVISSLFVLAVVAFVVWYYYAFMWSERFLAPVHRGMSQSQVQALVGRPLHTRTNDWSEVWSYTRSWSRDANVYFDTNGIVWAVEMD